AFIVALTGLELLVACLQAYVFAVLTCIYLNDALHMH
ncbi:MAG: F0F1 ATP synthase subunit A, partial [Kordiimonadaceae bacterium]|nr:F0F1 ATP synthase subunit A [Kordiimonadaceae bacterium]